MNATLKVLYRLKARNGKERARYAKWAVGAASSPAHRDRCWYEANMLAMTMGFINDEIAKAKKETP